MKRVAYAIVAALLLAGCGGSGGGKKTFAERADFEGARMGIKSGSAHARKVEALIPNVKISFFNSTPDIVTALLTGKVDAVPLDLPLAVNIIAHNPSLAIFPDVLAHDDYGFAVAKGSELAAKGNEALTRLIQNGTVKKLEEIWFSADESVKVMAKLDHKPDFDGSAGTIRYGCDGTVVPVSYTASDGAVVGFEPDIVRRIAYELNMNFEVSSMTFDALLPALASGKADMVGSVIAITEERLKSVDFVGPYYNGGVALLIKKERLGKDGAL